MKIGMISTPFLAVPPRDYGGTELVIHELTEGLVAAGHEVVLFATGDSSTSAELRSYYPRPQWPPDLMSDLNHVSWALQRARLEGVEVLHAHSAAALAMARLLPDIPLAYTLHHERDETLSAFYRHFADPWYVAISEDQLGREVTLRRVRVIHHGLDPDRYEWRPEAEAYVCFLGRMAPVKGPHTAMDVAAMAGVPIRVAGEIHPVDEAFGEREVRPRLAQPHVAFIGCVGMAAKVPLLRDARALLAPLGWNEPFGLAFIEAMLSGCPVVGFPHGSLRELIDPGVTGFLVHTPEEMAEAIRPGGVLDGFDRRRCRERAVERYSRSRMVREHLALYESVVAAAQHAPSEPGDVMAQPLTHS
jgi:glycosyltransferase involved in cell wall biosynthesis